MLLSPCLAVLITLQPPAQPAFMIDVQPVKKVEAVITFEVNAPKLKAVEWAILAPRLPELPGQTNVKSSLNFPSDNIEDLSPLKRPWMSARVKVKGKDMESSITIRTTYEADLLSRTLVPVPEGTKLPVVKPLTDSERKLWLRTSATLDFDKPDFKDWLKQNELIRKKDESDLEYGKRVYLFVTRKYDYYYRDNMNRAATAVCKVGKSDCGGLSILVVSALRSQGVPARLLAGRWAKSAKHGQRVGDVPDLQWHVIAEFFCDGIGWVPFDAASGLDRNLDPLECFGRDRGNFIALHVDTDVTFETAFAGKRSEVFLQSCTFSWSTAAQPESVTVNQDWQVKDR
jgi:hypothetical protein